jgi:hypothetical protein
MITDENLEHLERVLAESGLKISKQELRENFEKHPEGFDMMVTREGKNELEDSTLYFRKSDKGIFTHTEIKEKNFTFLANQLLDAEMPASVIPSLREAMIKGQSEITLQIPQTVKNQQTLSSLNFNYYPANGFHYWNNYQFQILNLPEGQNAGIPQKVFTDSNKWTNTYTPGEMVDLLMGGTVKKELVSAEGTFYVQEKKLDFENPDDQGYFKKVKANNETTSNKSNNNGKKNSTEKAGSGSRSRKRGLGH